MNKLIIQVWPRCIYTDYSAHEHRYVSEVRHSAAGRVKLYIHKT